MNWRSRSAALGLMLLIVPGATAHAQRGMEGGLHGLATFADFTFAGGGLHLGVRPGGRARLMLALTPGMIEDEFAFRGEVAGHFMLNPGSPGRGFYAGGGIAGVTGPADEAYLLLVIGLEIAPGGNSGWVFEGGIGGGARVLVGYRWRKLRR
jgi:hypothetical protein